MNPALETLAWHTSSRSALSGNCVEIALSATGDSVLMRDSKNRGGGLLSFGRQTFSAFVEDVNAGRFDNLDPANNS